jgi:hypothetical protein
MMLGMTRGALGSGTRRGVSGGHGYMRPVHGCGVSVITYGGSNECDR